MPLQWTKQAQFKEPCLNEIHIEPDGSKWEHVFHHNNPSQNLFASGDDFTNGIFKNEHLWFNFGICNKITSNWEVLVIQTTENYSTPIKLRWIQPQNPLDTIWANVASANITKNTDIGYASFNHGGLVRGNSSAHTYLTVNNGSNGNWWGAVGCFTEYQGGIPGFNGVIPKTGCIDIFICINNLNYYNQFYKDGIWITNNFYEY